MSTALAHISGPVLTTDRLTLRLPTMADFDVYAAFYTSEDSVFVGGPFAGKDLWRAFAGITGHWALMGYGWFFIERRDTGAVIGMTGVHHPPVHFDREIGWVLFTDRGQGFVTEAATAARDWAAATLPPARLVSYIDPDNAPSQAVARRLGATTDGERAAHDAGCEVWVHP
ncbi:hypothetical protein PARPLA_02098 [Rhodobacteraceae bacterium THAF1]|uniref:GNAT family N-acetyltransferase n=1 Tax=Palleronia sp. THAF1 TaxID=2587842 RepID=UPI000F3BF025|nr:GNAT family N-acetyltransferase [Palleronia sp. THAF1]QFU07811.1 hypothetical protein FIU81_03890 [Palleronia sp. THAF1]VDC25626.1 hypothetical protein PARPLA_02098 [Rhodobacteraceae bacterium THAF1]